MSIARVYTTKGPVRKDGLKCGKCGDPIVKGQDKRRTFSVGFRGYEQTRCMKSDCTPTRSELESSAVASVYDAIDSADVDGAASYDDLTSLRDEIAEAFNEVASEYEGNEMYDINEQLQERVEMLQNSASELEQWEPENEEPVWEAPESEPEAEPDEDFEQEHDDWLEEARESLRSKIDELEIP